MSSLGFCRFTRKTPAPNHDHLARLSVTRVFHYSPFTDITRPEAYGKVPDWCSWCCRSRLLLLTRPPCLSLALSPGLQMAKWDLPIQVQLPQVLTQSFPLSDSTLSPHFRHTLTPMLKLPELQLPVIRTEQYFSHLNPLLSWWTNSDEMVTFSPGWNNINRA